MQVNRKSRVVLAHMACHLAIFPAVHGLNDANKAERIIDMRTCMMCEDRIKRTPYKSICGITKNTIWVANRVRTDCPKWNDSVWQKEKVHS